MRDLPMPVDELFDAARHEPLIDRPWDETRVRDAVRAIGDETLSAVDPATGLWRMHPLDEPATSDTCAANLYWGAIGVAWALRHLAAHGAITLSHDLRPWIASYPARVLAEAAHEQHGTASWLFGETAAWLLAWLEDRDEATADRLHALVVANHENPTWEPMWGSPGTMLVAVFMAEASGEPRWGACLRNQLVRLAEAMQRDPETGTWLWEQDLYGKRTRFLGGGHGLAGNAYVALRAARFADAATVRTIVERTCDTLEATALRSARTSADGRSTPLINWEVLVGRERIAASRAKGGRPLVQDCHGAPGIVCRLAGAPRDARWDCLLRGAGELTWLAGPLAKGPSLCHGTAGSVLACLKLWRRFGEPLWLERARRLAMHAAQQVEDARGQHGHGRHSLWTGDLGVACVLWNCVTGEDRFPTLDHF